MWCRLALILLVLALALPVAAADKVALVIGNSAYRHAPALPNPGNDARAVADLLTGMGFEVVAGYDLDKAGLDAKVQDFARALGGADTALVFYAGHGLQVEGRNFLVPIDARLASEADLDFEAVDMDLILRQLERRQRTNLVFLDACRDNPLAGNLARSMGAARSAGIGRGLARIDGGLGTLIAYATQPGNIAADGTGNHSPFTEALLRHLPTPGLEVRQALSRVRKDVVEATDGKQVPWDHSSLMGDFILNPAPAEPQTAARLPAVPDLPAPGSTFQDCPDCPTLVVVPGGRYTMGSDRGTAWERPAHTVTVAPFALGRTEVTFDQYAACVQAGACPRLPGDMGYGRGDRPVIDVGWDEAQDYVRWLSRRTGKVYRLPTEAEWEYAARAGSAGRWAWGADPAAACRHGNVADRAHGAAWGTPCDDGARATAPVGRYAANAFGLHDMSGNVWEWVEDCWHEGYQGAPADGSAWTQGGDCTARVIRGGAWNFAAEDARVTNRGGNDIPNRTPFIGFRVARGL